MTDATPDRPVIGIHQPNYFPWLGYFAKIAQSDIFIFLDDVQFSKHGFSNRNRIKTVQGVQWLTVPVRARLGATILQTAPAGDRWREVHLKTLRGAYGRSPHFGAVFPWVEEMLAGRQDASLAALNIRLVTGLCRRLSLQATLQRSSDLPVAGTGDDRLIELVKAVRGAVYLSGRGAASYQEPEKFRQAGLGFRYGSFQGPVYDQPWGDFVEHLSVLDALFSAGWERTRELLGVSGAVGAVSAPTT